MHSQSQFLKLKGAQQPGNSYRSMGKKLHPPYPTKSACLYTVQFRSEKCSLILEERQPVKLCWHWQFSLWQSWLILANRTANSANLTLNAGVPTAPNSPKSSFSYLTAILSAKELNFLWACSTVSLLTGTDMITIKKRSNFNVNTVNTEGQKHIFTQWNLRANWLWN